MSQLRITSRILQGKVFAVETEYYTVGREPDNSIQIPHTSVSKHHAMLTLDDGDYKLWDLHSTNGVVVNGEPCVVSHLKDGDRIVLGEVELRFELTPKRSTQKIALPPRAIDRGTAAAPTPPPEKELSRIEAVKPVAPPKPTLPPPPAPTVTPPPEKPVEPVATKQTPVPVEANLKPPVAPEPSPLSPLPVAEKPVPPPEKTLARTEAVKPALSTPAAVPVSPTKPSPPPPPRPPEVQPPRPPAVVAEVPAPRPSRIKEFGVRLSWALSRFRPGRSPVPPRPPFPEMKLAPPAPAILPPLAKPPIPAAEKPTARPVAVPVALPKPLQSVPTRQPTPEQPQPPATARVEPVARENVVTAPTPAAPAAVTSQPVADRLGVRPLGQPPEPAPAPKSHLEVKEALTDLRAGRKRAIYGIAVAAGVMLIVGGYGLQLAALKFLGFTLTLLGVICFFFSQYLGGVIAPPKKKY